MVKCEECGKDTTSYYEKDGRKLCLGCYADSKDVDKISAKIDEKTNYYKNMGIVSIVIGVISFICYLFGSYMFGLFFLLLPLGIISLILGHISRKHGYKIGTYGFVLGSIDTILGIMWIIYVLLIIMYL